MYRQTLRIESGGRGLVDITEPVTTAVISSGVDIGLCHVFIQHTSASVIIQENADPDVLRDLDDWMSRMVPDGSRHYRHRAEGPDDMPAHIRSAITASSVTIPVSGGRPALGTWQGIYLYEHRHASMGRRVIITVHG